MTNAQSTVSRNRIALIVAAVIGLCFVGYGMQVVGWRLVDANGGNAGTFPAFFPPHSAISSLVAIALSAIAVFLRLRRNAATR
jgi:hypothetical protein